MNTGAIEQTVRTEQIMEVLERGMMNPKIGVVGLGGAGGNIVNNIYDSCKGNVQIIAINTDEKALQGIKAHKKLLIGKDVTQGKGANGFPEVGEYCAECAKDAIKDSMKDRDVVFIIAGMGGGTGTGTAPVVARIAKDLRTITFVIAINPFSFEGGRREKAAEGLIKLKGVAETTVVVDNDKLLAMAENMPIGKAFAIIDRNVVKIIDSFCSQVNSQFVSHLAKEVNEWMAVRQPQPEHVSSAPKRAMMPEMTVSNRPHISGAEAKMDGLVNMDMNNRDPMVQ
jgi:cell division protein FtsZ